VASQLMDPEVTFTKPASRSYSRRHRLTDGHSTLGQSSVTSEVSGADGSTADATHAKPRRRKKEEERQAEADQWAASMNSQLSEVDEFELLIQRG